MKSRSMDEIRESSLLILASQITVTVLSLLQNLHTLQRKLQEKETALLEQTQMVEFLQQELHMAEQQKQVLFHVLLIICFTVVSL